MAFVLGLGKATAEPVQVRAAPHDGFGRVVFNWQSPVPFRTRRDGDRLTVFFGRSIDADYGGLAAALSDYLRAIGPDAGGRAAVLTLAPNVEVRTFDLGNAVVVDLMAAAQGVTAPPDGPVTSGAPRIGVRVGEHKGYSRVVFDWPQRVGYRVERAGASARVVFDRPARFDLAAINRRPPPYLGGVSAQAEGEGVAVRLSIPETARLRDLRVDSKVVIDILAPDGAAPAAKAAASGEAVTTETPADRPRSLLPSPRAAATPPPAPEPARTPASPKETALAKARTQPPAETPSPPSAEKPAATAGFLAPLNAEVPQEPQPEAGPATAEAPPAAQENAESTTKAEALLGGDGEKESAAVSLRFDWNEPVAAAVFRRGGYLWVVFDVPTTIDVNALAETAGNVVRHVEQVPDSEATVLRFDTVAGINPAPRRDGLAWVLDFGRQPLAPRTVVEVKPQATSPVGPRLFLPVPEPGKVLPLGDPEAGDTIVVVPVIPLGHGIARALDYPQLRLLVSAQGVVIQPRIDALRVRALRQGIELTSRNELYLSSVSPEAAASVKLAAMRPLSQMLDFDLWKRTEPADFLDQREFLLAEVVRAEGAAREKARLDLARFFLANGFAAETLGVLAQVADARPEAIQEPVFRGLRGGAQYLMARYEKAADDLFHASLNDNDEATLWRAAVVAADGGPAQAAPHLRRTGALIRSYPHPLKVRLGLVVAESAIAIGDIDLATHYLDVLNLESPTPLRQAEIAYLEGRALEIAGDYDGAIGKWEETEVGPNRFAAARATVAKTELLLRLDKITPDEAIENLESLRFAWRGDSFEFDLLRRLGDLYIQQADYRNGLRTLRRLVTHFRDRPEASAVTEQMAEAFQSLYLKGEADRLAPVTAIALYEEFKELTPPGEEGDEMIRRLADRLVAVDLLERAAELLQAQIRFRLKGVDKARVGAQLALVRLMNGEADKALKTLDGSESPGLPEDLATRRRHLKARTLVDLERAPEALALLEGDESLDAERLRAEIYWQAKDWANAAQVLRRLARAVGAEPGDPLKDDQALTVLSLAVALTLSGNERGVQRTRMDYGQAMESTPYRDAFRLIAPPPGSGQPDIRNVAAKVDEAENFRTFLAEYRQRVKDNALSKIF